MIHPVIFYGRFPEPTFYRKDPVQSSELVFIPLEDSPKCCHPSGIFFTVLHIIRTSASSLLKESPHCCTMCFGRNLKEKVLKAIIIFKNNNSLKESATEIHFVEGDRGCFHFHND